MHIRSWLNRLRFAFKLIHCQKGLETISAVFMLFLMFTAIIGIVIAYANYNLSAQEKMNIDYERSLERIILSKQMDIETSTISSITIKNIGSIEVIIRAVYVDDNGLFTFFDPSKDMDTTIDPSGSITIQMIGSHSNDTKIVAATQKGTRTIDESLALPMLEPPPPPDTNEFYMGPLLLKFDNFWFQTFIGNFDPDGQWDPGWIVQSGPSEYCAWKIRVTNLGDKNITINGYSCFTTFPSGSSDYRSWFLWTEDQNNMLTLPVNESVIILFVRDKPESNGLVKIYSNDQLCMVFLTFYGKYEDETPYAQTIPFEAAITVE